MVALEIAQTMHMLVRKLQLRFVNEHRNVANIGKVQECRKQRGGGDAFVVCGGHISEGAGDQGAADAVPKRVDLILPRCPFYCVDGRKWSIEQVVRELLAGELGTRIDPGN